MQRFLGHTRSHRRLAGLWMLALVLLGTRAASASEPVQITEMHDGEVVDVPIGSPIIVELSERRGTLWELEEVSPLLGDPSSYDVLDEGLGVLRPRLVAFRWDLDAEALEPNSTGTIRFGLGRPWIGSAALETFEVTVRFVAPLPDAESAS